MCALLFSTVLIYVCVETGPVASLCLWLCLLFSAVLIYENIYGSVSAGREKWPFNVLFFFKSRASV